MKRAGQLQDLFTNASKTTKAKKSADCAAYRLESIANNEPPKKKCWWTSQKTITLRVTGAFWWRRPFPRPWIWGLMPPMSHPRPQAAKRAWPHMQNGFEVLRKSPILRLEGNKTVTLKNIRPPAKTLSLSAEALVDTTVPVALVFGPENGSVSERLVQESPKEAWLKNYTHLYVIGFAIQPNARQLIENCDAVVAVFTPRADGVRFYVPVNLLAADYSHVLQGRGVTLYAHTANLLCGECVDTQYSIWGCDSNFCGSQQSWLINE